jgi:hypothetical protein
MNDVLVGVGRNLAEDVSKENEQEKTDNKEGRGRSKLWIYIFYYEKSDNIIQNRSDGRNEVLCSSGLLQFK